jgi:mono/diheme cytochrome c family protein
MKKLALAVLAVVVIVILGLAVFVATYRPAQRPASEIATGAESLPSPAQVGRGAYLAHHVTDCFGCHTQRDWSRWGAPETGHPGAGGGCLGADVGADVPGQICMPNITSHRTAGVGGWTDGEILRAVREGVDRDGRALFPMMPYLDYRALSDEDAQAIVAYLRTLPPDPAAAPPTSLEFPVSFFIKMVPKPLKGPVAAPDRSDRVRYGEYLATISGCRYCHTPVDAREQPLPGKLFAGGHELAGWWGKVRSANLTPDATGLGSRGRNEFIGQFRSYVSPATAAPVQPGRNTPMPWLAFAGMTDDDLGAIYDYLRSLPPVVNSVERFPATSRE